MGLPDKVGVISDLHSNFEALKVAINWLDRHEVKHVICLGDIIGYNANPVEVAYLTWERCTFSLKGNHERYVLGEPARGVKEEKLEVIHWTRDQLSEEYLGWLRSLPDYHVYEDTFLLAHGSPRDPDEYIFRKNVVSGSLRHMEDYFPGIKICFFGHSHLPMLIARGKIESRFDTTRTVELDRNTTYLINPGSVGQPRDGVAKTAFGVMDLKQWRFTWVREDYDHETTARRIREAGLDATLATRLARGK
ncbi:MAG: metallophosphoesterase family protein [Planctomycetes bacterium]|nr:metallophosphoesterase family protein [Planctomycetota bacterium]